MFVYVYAHTIFVYAHLEAHCHRQHSSRTSTSHEFVREPRLSPDIWYLEQPYLSHGLNQFQSFVLLSQFLLIFGIPPETEGDGERERQRVRDGNEETVRGRKSIPGTGTRD